MLPDPKHGEPAKSQKLDLPERNPFPIAAQEMFVLEHTRWNHHTLLFLGIVAAVLASAQWTAELIPLWANALAAAMVSFSGCAQFKATAPALVHGRIR